MLLIVSVMLATVVNGQSLILDGRTKQFMREIEAHRFAYLVYTDRYRTVPGDDAHATERWSTARNGNGDGRLAGTYWDSVPNSGQLQVNAESGETINYWWHLRLAGLIPSSEAMTDLPQNLFGGRAGVQQSGYGMRSPVLCYENVPAGVAAAVDGHIDDGAPDAGALRSGLTPGALPSHQYDASGGAYLICASLVESRLGAVTPFVEPAAGNRRSPNPSAGNPNAHGGNPNAQGGIGGGNGLLGDSANPDAYGNNPNAQRGISGGR